MHIMRDRRGEGIKILLLKVRAKVGEESEVFELINLLDTPAKYPLFQYARCVLMLCNT